MYQQIFLEYSTYYISMFMEIRKNIILFFHEPHLYLQQEKDVRFQYKIWPRKCT